MHRRGNRGGQDGSGSDPSEANKSGTGGTPAQTAMETQAAEKKWRKFRTRGLAGLAMVFLINFIIYSGHGWVIATIMLIQVQVFREMLMVRYDKYKEEQEKKVPLFRTLMWCWFFAAMYWSYGRPIIRMLVLGHKLPYGGTEQEALRLHEWTSFGLYSLVFVLTVATMRKGAVRYQIGQVSWTVVTLCMVVLQTDSITTNVFRGLFWFVFPAALVVTNDVFAYFSGFCFARRFTNRPFLPFISPNKTWEGFIGGFICTAIFGFFTPLLTQFEWAQWLVCPATPASGVTSLGAMFRPSPLHAHGTLSCAMPAVFTFRTYTISVPDVFGMLGPSGEDSLVELATVQLLPMQVHGVLLATFASLVAPWGGFFASAIKRAFGKKDFDSIIPGHGGLTDRMDCQFIMALAAHVHYNYFVAKINGEPLLLTVSELLQSARMLTVAQQRDLHSQLGTMLAGGVGN
eukprot:g1267.t1